MSIIARGSRDGKSNNSMVDLEAEVEVSSSRRGTSNIHDNNTTNLVSHYNNPSKLEESDEDLLTVPDVEARPAMDSTNNNSNNNTDRNQNQKRRRGRNPVDKEYRRLRRLLRNRVSAQQARERKKVYVNDLESRAKELQDLNSKLEERISTMINENTMLRKVLLNTRPKVDDTTSTEQKQDQLAKS